MRVLDLARPDLRDFGGYVAEQVPGARAQTWLNANESPWANAADGGASLRRYPVPQPPALRTALAALYGCTAAQVLPGRGSDEAIDLLFRAFCRPGADAIVVSTPTFGMYAVNARLHGVPVIDVPLRETQASFHCDFDAVARAAIEGGARLVFVCAPGNPTGTPLPRGDIATLAATLAEQAMVVVDEAYIEFADGESAIGMIGRHPNVAVLRTLSKAHALAGARLGSVVAHTEIIDLLRRCQTPFPLPVPCVDLALRALAPEALAQTRARIGEARDERERLAARLRSAPGVRQVYPSQANFLLLRFDDAQAAFDALLDAGIVVRDVRGQRGLQDALRISIGTPAQNDAVVEAVERIARAVRA